MKHWKLVLAAALAIVAASICTALLWPNDDWRGPQRLPDGSVLTVKSVSFGQSFSCKESAPKAWQLAIGKRIPFALAARLGWRFNTQASISLWAAPVLDLFDLARGAKPNLSMPVNPNGIGIFTVREGPVAAAMEDIRVVVLDDEGDSLADDDGGGASSALDQKHLYYHQLHGWLIPAFPRRGNNIIVRFLRIQGGGRADAPIMEFHVPNPNPGPYPVWTPDPWPAKKSDGDLNVVLTDFVTGVSEYDAARPAAKDERAITFIKLDLRQSGPILDSWYIKSIEISDATGNCWRPFRLNLWAGYNQPYWTRKEAWRGNLWAGESAWKLKIELSPEYEKPSDTTASPKSRFVQFLAKPRTLK